MVKQPLPWRCILVLILIVAGAASVSAATHFVGWRRVGSGPSQTWFWNPANIAITVGDTIMWTNLGGIHSVNPGPNPSEPFCGTGTTEIFSCTVTFQNPGFFPYDCFQHLPTMTGSVTVISPPVAIITNLLNNTVVKTNTDIKLQATASSVNGSITNVQFLRGGIPFATNTVAPYAATYSNALAGTHIFRARAVDSTGNTGTSDSITVRAVVPPTLIVTNTSNGPLRFSFSTVVSVSYVVEGAVTLTNFSPIVTNAGNGTVQQFTQSNPAPAQKFFRLRLQ